VVWGFIPWRSRIPEREMECSPTAIKVTFSDTPQKVKWRNCWETDSMGECVEDLELESCLPRSPGSTGCLYSGTTML
jgi:hypothetical protein